MEEFRNLSRLENDVVQLKQVWPIDRCLTRDRSAPTRFSGILSRDRSAYIPRSIGASSGWLRVVEPIDRLMSRDRSAMLLPFSLRFFKLWPIDRLMSCDRSAMPLPFWARYCNSCRSIGCYAAIDRRWLCLCGLVFLCSKMFRFVYFFTSVSVLVLKSPVHSQNSLNNINLRNLTIIQA